MEAQASFCLLLLCNESVLADFSSAGRFGDVKVLVLSALHQIILPFTAEEKQGFLNYPGGFTVVCSTVVLPWRWRTVLDGLTLGNVPLSHFGSKVAATVRTLNIVWIFCRQDGRQVCGVSTFGNYLLDLSSLTEGTDERFMFLSPVALPRRFRL